jgi:hypothetical protein
MCHSKHHWTQIKSIGIAPAGNQKPFRFVMETMREPVKLRSNFPSMLKPINGSADAEDQDENLIVTVHINRGAKAFFLLTLHLTLNPSSKYLIIG